MANTCKNCADLHEALDGALEPGNARLDAFWSP
jgi:hypothetical protein